MLYMYLLDVNVVHKYFCYVYICMCKKNIDYIYTNCVQIRYIDYVLYMLHTSIYYI